MLLEDGAVGLECICCRWAGIRDPGVREALFNLGRQPLSRGREGPGWWLCQARLTPPAADEHGI